MRFTLPSSVFRLLSLAHQISKQQSDPKVFKKIFELARRLIEKLGSLLPVLSIKLYLQLILAINQIDKERYFDEYTYETASECLLLYESQISDSTTKQVILEMIINSCLRLHCLSDENYDILLSNITSYCSKILKKNEQCQILLSCCYLFTNPQVFCHYNLGRLQQNSLNFETVRKAGEHMREPVDLELAPVLPNSGQLCFLRAAEVCD